MNARTTCACAVFSLAALAIFTLVALSVHVLRPELDWVHAQMSVYLLGPWAWMLQSAYVALACGMLALAAGLHRALPRPARSGAPLLLFAIAATALVVTAYAPMRFPGEDQRLEHLVHGITAQTAFLCATTAMVLQSLRLRHAPAWRAFSRVAVVWAVLCFFGVWALALLADLPRGLAQKALVAAIVAWLVAVALGLYRMSPRRAMPPGPGYAPPRRMQMEDEMPDHVYTPLEGGCLCGAIRYRLLSPPTDCGYCHCSLCRRASGAPVLVFATVPRGDLEFVRGAPRRHRSSASGARWFCSDCGTQLCMQVDAEPLTTDVTVASLDTPEALPPGFHIWDTARIPWFDTADPLERFAQGRPQDG